MRRVLALALFPTLTAFARVMVALSALVPDRDFSHIG